VHDQVSHPYKTSVNYNLIFSFLCRRQEVRTSWSELRQAFYEFNLLLISPWIKSEFLLSFFAIRFPIGTYYRSPHAEWATECYSRLTNDRHILFMRLGISDNMARMGSWDSGSTCRNRCQHRIFLSVSPRLPICMHIYASWTPVKMESYNRSIWTKENYMSKGFSWWSVPI
jgi:hypothetical protein